MSNQERRALQFYNAQQKMDNKEKILKAEELLKVNKQENVLKFFKKLSEDKQINQQKKL